MESGGVVAWGQGAPDYVHGCVMHRAGPDAPVAIEDLPFLPARGTWWRGRMYWACWPAGVGSWAPGEEVTFSLPDLSLCGIGGDDSGLLARTLGSSSWRGIERRVLTHGWKWQPGRDPEPVALGPYGAASCRSTAAGWTARSASRCRRRHAGIDRWRNACVALRLPIQGGVGGAIAAGWSGWRTAPGVRPSARQVGNALKFQWAG